jgi:hypothetical protein
MTNEIIAKTISYTICDSLIMLSIIADKLFWPVVILTFIVLGRETTLHTTDPEMGLSLILPNDEEEDSDGDYEDESDGDYEDESDGDYEDESDEDYEYESDEDDEEDSDEDYEYESDEDDEENSVEDYHYEGGDYDSIDDSESDSDIEE